MIDFGTMREIAHLKTREDAARFVGVAAKYEDMNKNQRERYDMIVDYMTERNARRRRRRA